MFWFFSPSLALKRRKTHSQLVGGLHASTSLSVFSFHDYPWSPSLNCDRNIKYKSTFSLPYPWLRAEWNLAGDEVWEKFMGGMIKKKKFLNVNKNTLVCLISHAASVDLNAVSNENICSVRRHKKHVWCNWSFGEQVLFKCIWHNGMASVPTPARLNCPLYSSQTPLIWKKY